MWVQVVLVVITLGIYTIYWFYVTLKELHVANGSSEGALMWTILWLIPIVNYFAYWHYSFAYDKFTTEDRPGLVMFILWIVIPPVVWFLVQRDLNAAARGSRPRGV